MAEQKEEEKKNANKKPIMRGLLKKSVQVLSIPE